MNALLVVQILASLVQAQDSSFSTGDWVGRFMKHDSSTFIHVRFASDGVTGSADLPQDNAWGLGYYVAGFQEDLARWIQSRVGVQAR